jgi:diketogulonate reductase-like aldo/keto reductase
MSSLAMLAALQQALAAQQPPGLTLHNAAAPGMVMSAGGLGTGGPGCYNESSDQLASYNSSLSWLRLGGRRFDGAISYACDRGIGAAIAQSGVPRREVFVTSKIGPGGVPFPLGYNETKSQAKRILADLDSSYVDLLLIHEPFSYWPDPQAAQRAPSSDPACDLRSPATYSERGCRLSTWRALVELWHSGAALAIGVSNFNSTHIEEIEQIGLALPAVNQVEFSPLHQGNEAGGCNCGASASRSTAHCGDSATERAETCAKLHAFMKRKQIVFNSYSPFGGGGSETAKLLSDPRLRTIGDKHNVSVAQVILNWQWSKGIVVNPQANNVAYQSEDLHFADFMLDAAEVALLDRYEP